MLKKFKYCKYFAIKNSNSVNFYKYKNKFKIIIDFKCEIHFEIGIVFHLSFNFFGNMI